MSSLYREPNSLGKSELSQSLFIRLVVTVTPMGLMLNVGEASGGVAFLGYRQFQDGSKGPAEMNNLIRQKGDVIIAVNGQSTVGRSFKEVIPKLRESPVFSFMRLVHADYEVDGGFTSSCGPLGKFLDADLRKRFKSDRRRLLAKRSLALINDNESDGDSSSSDDAADDLDDDSDSDGSASDIEPDSEDDALLQEKGEEDSDASMANSATGKAADTERNAIQTQAIEEDNATADRRVSDIIDAPGLSSILVKQESTRHLAYGLLDLDVGYSSDEGGDEEVAYYVSDVDFRLLASHL